MPQQLVGVAGSGPDVVVHERRAHQEVLQSRLLTGGNVRQLFLLDAVIHRHPQQHLLLLAGDFPPEKFVEQPVHIVEFRQLVGIVL